MSKDVRPVYMGTFEKYKKEVEDRLSNLSATQYHHNKQITKLTGRVYLVGLISSLVGGCLAIGMWIWLSYMMNL